MSHNNSDTISERRLRPIYDWLDNGNNKKALAEAEKVLRKQPNFQCCRALKSLALMRLGKEDEALVTLDKILAESPVEEGALQAMSIGYKEMRLPERICTLYENATKKEPGNEEFLSHLFMAYVRLGQLKKQQATAMNLYKAKSKNPYYFWSVMSLVLQAMEGDEKMAQTVSLPLANKMVEKMEKEGKMEQEQETMIYLMILELRKDWKGALDVLNGPLGKKLENSASFHLHCINKRIELEERLENWSEVARLSRNILLSQPDSWDTVYSYIKAVLNLKGKDKGEVAQYDLKPNRIDRTVEEAERLLTCLSSTYQGLRGPYLARLEITYRTQPASSTRLQHLLMEYIDAFGSRPVCFSDIKKYLRVIPVEERNNFILKLRERYPDTVPTSPGEIYREICVTGVERFLGKHLNISLEKMEVLVHGMLNRYVATQPLVAHIESTEIRPSDGYMLIASHLLWDRWQTTRNNRFFLLCCSMIRLGLKYSPSNWQLMFVLIRLCGFAGAGNFCEEVHTSLDVKHLMLDTLGWILPRILSSSGQVDRLDRLYSVMSRFYANAPKETIEYIIQAYKCGNFPQICDINNLKRRIMASFAYPLIETERLILNLLFKTSSHEQAVSTVGFPEYTNPDPIDWENLRDNRDFRTIQSYEPEELETTEEIVALSFKSEISYLRLRNLVLKGLVSSLCLTGDVLHFFNNKSGESSVKEWSSLDKVVADLESQVLKSEAILEADKWILAPQAPFRSRLSSYLPSHQVDLVLCFLRAILKVHQRSESQVSEDLSVSTYLDELVQYLSSFISSLEKEIVDWEKDLVVRWSVLERLQFLAESLCIGTVIAGSILSIFRSQKGGKKGKKTIVCAKFTALIPKYTEVVEYLEKLSNLLKLTIQTNYKNYSDELDSEGLVDTFSGLSVNLPSLLGAEKQNLLEKIKSSYQSQQDQMLSILEEKLKYLQALKV